MTPRAPSLPPDERRAALVAAARPLVQQFGADYTTRQVAEAAGVAEGTVFRVFSSKQELTAAVLADLTDPAQTIEALAGIDPRKPLAKRLAATIAALHDAIHRVSAVFALMARPGRDVATSNHPMHDPAAWQRREQQARDLEQAITDVLAPDAELLRCTPREAAALVRATAFGTAHPHLGGRVATLDPAALAALLLGGLLRPADPHSTHSSTAPEASC